MKRKNILALSGLLAVCLILITLSVLSIRIFEDGWSIDLNTGDSRYETYISSLKIKSRILQTSFSKQVRRLGIDIPDERRWMIVGKRTYKLGITGIHSSQHYTILPAQFESFISFFDRSNMSDNERTAFLKEALAGMKKEKASDIEDALEEILDKLRKKSSGEK